MIPRAVKAGCPGVDAAATGRMNDVALLTAGRDPHYALGLATALIARGVSLDFIGSDEVDSPRLHGTPRVRFLNLRGDQRRNVALARKISRVAVYYARLLRYAAVTPARVFHILWNNKFEHFDRTLLMLYYKLLNKKVVLTAHNVNQGRRDSTDSLLNRLTLRAQYRLVDHVFAHTEAMKRELVEAYGVADTAVTVIPYGINDAVPDTDLTAETARERLGITPRERTILFFGNIAPYKGLDYLIAAFHRLAATPGDYRLIIAGMAKKGSEAYLDELQQTIRHGGSAGRVIQKLTYIPDEDTELYFKAADVFVLPYREIFQSGVLFLGYRFGLPVIAADVGTLKDDIVDGETGFVFRPGDPADLAKTVEAYFASDLFQDLKRRRGTIREYANARHSWDTVGRLTAGVYAGLLGASPSPGLRSS
jgi:D-inositol-3-phosphate glycosyltransferase